MSARFTIRRKVYRGRPGWLVSGPGGIFGTSIWVQDRTTAEWVRMLLRAGIDPEIEDMTLAETRV